MLVNPETLTNFILDKMEDEQTPNAIVDLLRQFDHRPLTVNHQKLLQENVDETCIIRRQYGMTHIEWGKYGHENDLLSNGSLLVAHSEKNVVIDVDWIIEKNATYFWARVERNRQRKAVLENAQAISNLATKINNLQRAIGELKPLLGFHGDFCADRYSIAEFAGLDEVSITS